jgi:hypothetical protein
MRAAETELAMTTTDTAGVEEDKEFAGGGEGPGGEGPGGEGPGGEGPGGEGPGGEGPGGEGPGGEGAAVGGGGGGGGAGLIEKFAEVQLAALNGFDDGSNAWTESARLILDSSSTKKVTKKQCRNHFAHQLTDPKPHC